MIQSLEGSELRIRCYVTEPRNMLVAKLVNTERCFSCQFAFKDIYIYIYIDRVISCFTMLLHYKEVQVSFTRKLLNTIEIKSVFREGILAKRSK